VSKTTTNSNNISKIIQRSESKKILDSLDPLRDFKPATDYSKDALAERKQLAKRRVL
jgi:hypothetical protein